MTKEEAKLLLIRPTVSSNVISETKAREIEAYNMAIEALSAEAEWIPISEGLPKEHEWVGTKQFGTTISDKVHITFDVNGERFVKTLSLQNGELSNYEKQTMDTFYKGWKMLAWKPLPEPYREESEVEE